MPYLNQFVATRRLELDGIGNNTQTGNEPTHNESLKMALKDWRVYYLAVMYMLATGSQTIQYFIPTLVGQLGYAGYDKQYVFLMVASKTTLKHLNNFFVGT